MDAVTFQVIQSRLSGIVQEMQEHIFRTGYSTIVRESQDASCMILDVNGDVVGEHVVLPLHVAALPEVVRAIRRAFGDEIVAGDAFVTNHPYESGLPHSMDMAVVTPVFWERRLVAFCGSIAHKSDLGGVVPGTANANATELFQEGFQLPPVRFVRAGEPVRDVEALLRANSRTPELVLGDIRGQVGVARLGERRVAETIARYGLDAVLETFAHKQDVTERRIRAALASWPDGTFEGESFLDDGGADPDRPVRFQVRVEKRGDRILFDFSGSDDQAPTPINIRPPLARGCCYYALIASVDPQLSNNGGVARVVESRFRSGSIVDPRYPAPCNTYMPSAIAVTEAVLRALSEFVPARRMAGVGGFGAVSIGGRRADGSRFVQYDLAGSAYGGRAGSDGPSGIAVLLSNARSAPIEVIESEFPTRIRRFELIPDSGGPGEFRGGLAARRAYELLADEAQLSLRASGHRCAAFGRDRGAEGRPAACRLERAEGKAESLPSRFSGVTIRRGDVAIVDKGGGGGLGDPRRRPFPKIVDDVLDGYVTREAAVAFYGVDPNRLDEALRSWNAPNPAAPLSALR
jgi:N-methylhydantoinase B